MNQNISKKVVFDLNLEDTSLNDLSFDNGTEYSQTA